MRKVGVDLKLNNSSRAERPRWVDQRRFNKEKKRRLRVLNIYDHNVYMRLDKKHKAEGIAKIYKETNKELKEWRASVQRQKDGKQNRVAMVIIQKYICKWMARRIFLKLLSATTFIQCCWT
jgi:hypothetical protein